MTKFKHYGIDEKTRPNSRKKKRARFLLAREQVKNIQPGSLDEAHLNVQSSFPATQLHFQAAREILKSQQERA